MNSHSPSRRPIRRARLTRAEWILFGIFFVALLLLGLSAYVSQKRAKIAATVIISGDKWHLSQGRARMASARVGHTLWILGGLDFTGTARGDVETLDLSRDPRAAAVATLLLLPILPRHDQTAQAVGTDIYIFGGLSPFGQVVGDVEKLDTLTGAVTAMAPMPTPRRMAHSVASGGKIYVIGGADGLRKRVGTLEIYDVATDTWTSGPPMSAPRECDVALWNGQIIVAGGYNGERQNGGVLKTVESYDIKTRLWRKKPDLVQPISAHHVVVSGDWEFLFGDYLTLSRVLALNARTGISRELPNTGFVPRRHVVAATLNNRVVIAGGSTNDARPPLNMVQVFDLKRLKEMANAAR